MIDLGKTSDLKSFPEKTGKNKKYYPSIYISGVPGLEVEVGDITFLAKGKVVSCTETKRNGEDASYSCEIELHGIDVKEYDASDDIDEAMDKISKKKSESY